MTVTRILGSAALVLAMVAVDTAAAPGRKCPAEAERLVGRPAAVVDQNLKAPRKLRGGSGLDFSGMGERRGSGNWLGEALVGTDGTVRQVWTLRSPQFEPAWPEFDEVVAANLRQWAYEPMVIDGTPTPVCMVIAVTINWR